MCEQACIRGSPAHHDLFFSTFILVSRCVNKLVYEALLLTMTYLPGDRYVIFTLFAVAEIAASIIHIGFLMKYVPFLSYQCYNNIIILLLFLKYH